MEETTNVQSAPESAPAEQNTESHAEQHGQVGLHVDERTGRRTVVSIPHEETPKPEPTAEPEAPAEPPKEAPQTVFPEPQAAPAPYTPAEMSLAMQMGSVDESRIPANIMPQYAAMKAKDAPPAKSPDEVRQEFYKKVTADVEAQTMKECGITEDEVAMGEYSDDPEIREKVAVYKTALEVNRKRAIETVYDKISAAQKEQAAQQEFRQGVSDWMNEQRAQEPHFDEIGQFMTEYYKKLPYDSARNIAPAVEAALSGKLTPQTAEVIKKYYEACRKEFYAGLNGTSTTPTPRTPAVEPKGGGRDVSKPENYGEMLRKASPRDKPRIIAAWMNSLHR